MSHWVFSPGFTPPACSARTAEMGIGLPNSTSAPGSLAHSAASIEVLNAMYRRVPASSASSSGSDGSDFTTRRRPSLAAFTRSRIDAALAFSRARSTTIAGTPSDFTAALSDEKYASWGPLLGAIARRAPTASAPATPPTAISPLRVKR
ncbi:MAG: hypothetical protein IPJ65_15350 [Archangiaceae bacterium]|nr:hypothetical protein [Archangiaceae bacterium]